MPLQPWMVLEGQKWDSLVLGNGASIAVDSRFSYFSLFDAARDAGLISRGLDEIFAYFKTTDFELILRMLTHASKINQALHIADSATSAEYVRLRRALVQSVRTVHVPYDRARGHLDAAGEYLSRFDTVVSLNYDLFVYWAILKWNADHGANWFEDCFVDQGKFERDWRYLRTPHRPAARATLVFYAHGNLAFASSVFGEERKLESTDQDGLLEAIFAKWNSGDWSPLFVSEGTSTQKRLAIERSVYLKTVHDEVLPDLGRNAVIYGWAMADQDEHVMRAILGSLDLRRLAISVMPKDSRHVDALRSRVQQFARNPRLRVDFFDATSDGCWINPQPARARRRFKWFDGRTP